ncbi:MAG: MarR family transcriptional regulator [Monoglobales bacterium]
MKDSHLLVLLRKIIQFKKLIFAERQIDLSFELGKTQRGVLMYIAFNGPVPMKDVSEKFALEKGSFTQVADGLEALELIERKRSDTDRRIINLETTEKGKEVAEEIHKATEKQIESLLQKLTTEQKENFIKCLSELAEYIDIIRGEK